MLDKQIEMQKKIETYIQKGLPSDEEDELWVEFLLDKSWYRYYVILDGIYTMAMQGKMARKRWSS